jgi:O-antigen/teichoic acid export membrane protein
LLRKIIHTFATQLAKIALLGGISILTARFLGPENRGLYALFVSTANLLSLIGCFGTQNAITRHAVVGEGETAFQTSVWHGLAIFGILLTASFAINIIAWEQYSFYIFLMPFSVFSIMIVTYTRELALGLFRQGIYNFYSILPNMINLAILTLVFLAGVATLDAAVFAFVTSVVAAFAVSLLTIKRVLHYPMLPAMDISTYRQMLNFGKKCLLSAMLEFANLRFGLYFIAALSISKEIGYYSVALSVALASLALPSAISVVLFPESARSGGSFSLKEKTCQLTRITFLLEVIFAVIMIFASEWIFEFLFSMAFMESAQVFRLMLPGIIAVSVSRVMYGYLLGADRPDAGVKAGMVSVIISILCYLILIPPHGAAGAAISFSIGYGAGLLVMLSVYARVTSASLPEIFITRPYDFAAMINRLKGRRPGIMV